MSGIYRRKYQTLEALQYTGENHEAIVKFLGDSWKHWVYTNFSSERWVGLFRTGSYDSFVYVGGYVVKLESGIFRAYTQKAFEATFEKEPQHDPAAEIRKH